LMVPKAFNHYMVYIRRRVRLSQLISLFVYNYVSTDS
jgi:hypothetical protein